jgi:three-Cys-motif partner protein
MSTNKFFESKKRWSNYKDMLLKNYLPLYFAKILKTRKDTLFIDGFAGRGTFDDGTMGSPLIVRDILEEAMQRTKYSNIIIPIFIEYKKKYAKALKESLNNNKCYVINSNYKDEALKIIKRNSHRNIFLYVDPFGIKYIDYAIFEELSKNKNSVELLLNLNSFGFIREGIRLLGYEVDNELEVYKDEEDDGSFVNNIENMNKIANGDYWQKIIKIYKEGLIDSKQAESMFVEQYMETLGKDFQYIFQIPIKTGDHKMPKYRMVFATNHIQGALHMSDTMIKCNSEMSLENHNFQGSLFDYDFNKFSCKNDIIEMIKELKENGTNRIDCKDLCLLLYNKNGAKYMTKDIRKAIQQLEVEKIIKVDRNIKTTASGKLSKALDFVNETIYLEIL